MRTHIHATNLIVWPQANNGEDNNSDSCSNVISPAVVAVANLVLSKTCPEGDVRRGQKSPTCSPWSTTALATPRTCRSLTPSRAAPSSSAPTPTPRAERADSSASIWARLRLATARPSTSLSRSSAIRSAIISAAMTKQGLIWCSPTLPTSPPHLMKWLKRTTSILAPTMSPGWDVLFFFFFFLCVCVCVCVCCICVCVCVCVKVL